MTTDLQSRSAEVTQGLERAAAHARLVRSAVQGAVCG
jgi:hypothetical protein